MAGSGPLRVEYQPGTKLAVCPHIFLVNVGWASGGAAGSYQSPLGVHCIACGVTHNYELQTDDPLA